MAIVDVLNIVICERSLENMRINSNHEYIDDIDISDLESANIACPRCHVIMRIFWEGSSPDNETSWLVCPNCHWAEKE